MNKVASSDTRPETWAGTDKEPDFPNRTQSCCNILSYIIVTNMHTNKLHQWEQTITWLIYIQRTIIIYADMYATPDTTQFASSVYLNM